MMMVEIEFSSFLPPLALLQSLGWERGGAGAAAACTNV